MSNYDYYRGNLWNIIREYNAGGRWSYRQFKGSRNTVYYNAWCDVTMDRAYADSIQIRLIKKCGKLISPVMRWMFPDVSMEHKAMEYMTTNVIANIFGLGWAATPAGIKAMEELAKLNDMRKEADDAMCAFLVINISSLQLIPVNIIAYRSQYGSVNPTAVALPGLIATIISTVAGIIYCKLKYTKNK